VEAPSHGPSVNSFKARIDKHWKWKKWSNIRHSGSWPLAP